ncbi:MAG: signal peptidase II [Chloroflexota bacterium]
MIENTNQDEVPYEAPPATWTERLVPFIVMAAVLLLDQFTKRLVETNLPLYGVWAPIPALEPYFRILHTTNTGMAFGLFQQGGTLIAIVAVIVTGVIVYFNQTLPGNEILLRIALGLQLGGVLGNLIDRFRQGHVTDFLDFGPVPIFNIADASLVCGVILLGIVMLLEDRRHKSATAE